MIYSTQKETYKSLNKYSVCLREKEFQGSFKFSKPHPEGFGKRQFFTMFCIEPLGTHALDPTMFNHFNPITEEGAVFVPHKLPHNTYDLIIVSKMATTHVGFKFRKQEKVRWSYVW